MPGYYRFPTINKDKIIFACEDDLWTVSIENRLARRLTSNLGEVSNPFLSPDGKEVAFTGREEGHPEVYSMPAVGGVAKRLTFSGANSFVVGWSPDGKDILFASDTGQPFNRITKIYSVHREKSIPQVIPVGQAREISYGPKKGVVIGRNIADPARWKRYRGGRAGEIWIDRNGDGNFQKLVDLEANLASPMWLGKRIYFISDHEGIGNVYSCTPEGRDLKRHTNQVKFYVRNATTDGRKIVYHAGADIYVYDPEVNLNKKIEIEYHSPRVQVNRKFVPASKYLEDYAIHPKACSVALVTRGKVFAMPNWEGPVYQAGANLSCRYRLGRWLYDGKRIVLVSDEKREDGLESHYQDSHKKPIKLPFLDIGRPVELEPSPTKPLVALANHRFELILVNLLSKKRIILDRSRYNRITNISWSPDGQWLAYSFWNSQRTSGIKLCNVRSKKTCFVTKPVRLDFSPSFDPEGKYLYFLSNRDFDPVYDTVQFELSFPANIRPYLLTLKKELPSPFRYTQIAPVGLEIPKFNSSEHQSAVKIDLAGIEERIVPLPLPPAKYGQIWGIKDKILFTTFPIEGAIKDWFSEEIKSNGRLEYYDLKEQKRVLLTNGVSNFKVSGDGNIIIYRAKDRLRIIKPLEEVDKKLAKEPPGPKSGWLDLSRIKVMVEPKDEWHQMYHDAWRLQRDHFWTKDMSGIDWKLVYKKYLPLLACVGTRSEFSDLIWEMQGELGTSHAYEWGGDYRKEPSYRQGFLGADLKYDKKFDAYRITRIIKGDPWDKEKTSPLLTPGVNIKEGDIIIALDGRRTNSECPPQEFLVNQAETEIHLTVAGPNGKNSRTVSIKTLRDETPARYRDWVEENREIVHQASKGQIGYVHIPDMGPSGFAEFHRYFLSEIHYPALIVDARYNRGGHVSQLLLEKLARKRVGYDISRWGVPEPYPSESVLGPIVAITNEYAGSDGDIFSHAFKLYKIGPLIGKRTWGGVIGISPYYHLSDGGLTTQPEYSFWFTDVGWGVENYGTDPDIEVEISPQDYVKGRDPQLQRAIKEGLNLLKKHKPKIPNFGKRPNLRLPTRL